MNENTKAPECAGVAVYSQECDCSTCEHLERGAINHLADPSPMVDNARGWRPLFLGLNCGILRDPALAVSNPHLWDEVFEWSDRPFDGTACPGHKGVQ